MDTLIKLVYFDEYSSNSTKLTVGEPPIIQCGYESRSGLHWTRCYNAETMKEIKGIRVIVEEVAKFRPMRYEDAFKPIPPEGKNVMGMMPQEFEKLMLEIAEKLLEKLPSRRGFTVITHENGFEIAVTQPYEYLLVGRVIANQANLLVIDVTEMVPREIEEAVKRLEPRGAVEVGNHTVAFSERVQALELRSPSGGITGYLVRLELPAKTVIIHPEHEKVELDLEPGLYVLHERRGLSY